MNPAGIENIDFSPVGATNLRSLDVSSALVKEKLSLMILASRGTAPTFSPTFVGSEFEHATDNSLQRVNNAFLKPNPHFIVEKSKTKYGVSLKDLHNLSFFEIAEDYPKKPLTYPSPYCISIRPGAEFADISI